MNLKRIIGLVAILFIIAFLVILILRIWGIEIISIQNLIKSNLTLVALGVGIVILTILYGGFFRSTDDQFDKSVGNRTHPKKKV